MNQADTSHPVRIEAARWWVLSRLQGTFEWRGFESRESAQASYDSTDAQMSAGDIVLMIHGGACMWSGMNGLGVTHGYLVDRMGG